MIRRVFVDIVSDHHLTLPASKEGRYVTKILHLNKYNLVMHVPIASGKMESVSE